MRMVGSLGSHAGLKDDALPSFLIGDRLSRGADGRVTLSGNAQVRRLDSVVKGDRIDYLQSTGEADVLGNGVLMRDGNIVQGPHLRYNVDSETGQIDSPHFWLSAAGGGGGAGTADEADIISRQHMRLKNVRYSGWPGPNPSWYIDSSRVDLYLDENEGEARHGVLYFKDVPILYSPWLTFPLGKDRKSGFLIPTYGTSSNGGIEITTPYYLNLAPNYDATISPRLLSKRGLLLGTEFRYLSPVSYSQLFGTYMVHDRQTGEDRWMYSVQHNERLGAGFKLAIDARKVSDDDYFRDFASFGLSDADVTHLRSQATLRWSGSPYLSGFLQFRRYQTLQDATSDRFQSLQYDILPRLSVTAQRYDWHGLDIVSENTATRFVKPIYYGSAFPAQDGRRRSPNGTRLTSYTSISRPFMAPGAYLTPKIGLHMSQYQTEWFEDTLTQYQGRPNSQTRVLPIASLDTGLTFERDTSLFGNAAIQTLEPRLYYLYVPYRDQSELPVYDTALATFNFQQAFSENIFSGGWDRIANANQLTAGLTSRWLDADTGFERLSLSFAQRFYFEPQKVTRSTEDPRTDTESDYLVGGRVALTDKFSVYFDGQYNHDTLQRNRISTGVRWNPKRLASVSLSYRYERDAYAGRSYDQYGDRLTADSALTREQVSLAGQWPLSRRWYGVGRYDYSLAEHRNTQSILGLEYRGDRGWAARAVFQRYAVSAEDSNTALFLQLELTGLGSLGTDPMSLLSKRVIGYQPVTTPASEKTVFERYE